MLRPVPHIYIRIAGPGGDDVGILGLVAGLVDLSRVHHPLDYGELDLLLGCAISAQLLGVGVVVCQSRGRRVGQGQVGDLQVVGRGSAGVCANNQAVGAHVLAGDLLHVGQPLCAKGGPLEGAAVEDVVEQDRVFLPYLVLLVDEFVLDLLLVGLVAWTRNTLAMVCCRTRVNVVGG
jgi:hypothetical protein